MSHSNLDDMNLYQLRVHATKKGWHVAEDVTEIQLRNFLRDISKVKDDK